MPKFKKEIVKFHKMELNEVGCGKKGTEFAVTKPIKGQMDRGIITDLKEFAEFPVPRDADVYRYTPQKFMDPETKDITVKKEEPVKKPLKKIVKSPSVTVKKKSTTPAIIEEKNKVKQMKKVLTEDPKFVEKSDKAVKKIVQYNKNMIANFLALGIELMKFKREKLYLTNWETFPSFIEDPDVNVSSSNAYRCMDIVERWIGEYQFTHEQLINAGIKKLDLIKSLPHNKVEAEEWLGKATTLSHSDLKKEVRESKGQPVYEIDSSKSGLIDVRAGILYFTETKTGQERKMNDWLATYIKDCNVTATIKIRSKEANK